MLFLYAISVWIYIACASYCYNYSYYSSSYCCYDYDTTPLTTTTTTGCGHAILVLESQPFGYVNHYMMCPTLIGTRQTPTENPGFTRLVFEIPLKHQISWISAKGWNKRALVDNAANHERILWSQAPWHLARSKGHLQQSRLGFPVDGYESINWIVTPWLRRVFLKEPLHDHILLGNLNESPTSFLINFRFAWHFRFWNHSKMEPFSASAWAPVVHLPHVGSGRLHAESRVYRCLSSAQCRNQKSIHPMKTDAHWKGASLDLKPLF